MKRIFLHWGRTINLAADFKHLSGNTSRNRCLTLLSRPIPLAALLFCLFTGVATQAAGPKMGQFYLGLGGGVYDPLFTLDASEFDIDGPIPTTTLFISLPGLSEPLELDIQATTTENQTQTENRPMISLGGMFGYQMTPEFGAEIGLDLSLLEIDIQNLFILQDVVPGNPETVNIQVLPPDLLPITFSGVYTFLPNKRISPYLGFGVMIALLDNRRSQSVATDILVLDGGIELGYIAHAGIKMAVSDTMYGFFDIKYGRISNPEIEDRFGTGIKVDKYEVRHMRFGVSYPLDLL